MKTIRPLLLKSLILSGLANSTMEDIMEELIVFSVRWPS